MLDHSAITLKLILFRKLLRIVTLMLHASLSLGSLKALHTLKQFYQNHMVIYYVILIDQIELVAVLHFFLRKV